MWPFSNLTPKPQPPLTAAEPVVAEPFLSGFEKSDYLGRAMCYEKEAQRAVKGKRFDEAWRFLHEQKQEYGKHAARYGMTARQTVALDGSVHEQLANICRLEGKHNEALAHLLYCVFSSSRPTAVQEKKIIIYFNRCSFVSVQLRDLREFRETLGSNVTYQFIQAKVGTWRAKN